MGTNEQCHSTLMLHGNTPTHAHRIVKATVQRHATLHCYDRAVPSVGVGAV
jgi:hypothetical protein